MSNVTDIGAVARALATAVQTNVTGAAKKLTGLRYIPRKITAAPLFAVGERTTDYDGAMHRGLDEWLLDGRLYAGSMDNADTATDLLDQFLAPVGSTSVKTAIEADKTLGGTCSALRVERIRSYAVFVVADVPWIGARFDIRVW